MAERRQILVVEDNAQNLELVEFLLEEAGFTVRAAHDAIELRAALARMSPDGAGAAGEATPDLILMDIQLPGVDGLTLVDEIRQRQELAAVPVVALTAHAMRGDRERFLAAGCDGYISKPVDIATFADEVEAVLAAGRRE